MSVDTNVDTKTTGVSYPVFEDISVSTKTFIIMSNITIDLSELYKSLPITKYVVVPKKRGRKKKTTLPDPNRNIPAGSIITVDPGKGGEIRGVNLKKKKKKERKSGDYFRNSLTVVMIIDNKKINFKVCRNGKFQMTGCKTDSQSEECIYYMWRYMKGNITFILSRKPQTVKNPCLNPCLFLP